MRTHVGRLVRRKERKRPGAEQRSQPDHRVPEFRQA
jgi:hypothetical protein